MQTLFNGKLSFPKYVKNLHPSGIKKGLRAFQTDKEREDKLDKERISVWLPKVFEVEDIKHEKDQEFYYLKDYKKPVLRHELLKIRGH